MLITVQCFEFFHAQITFMSLKRDFDAIRYYVVAVINYQLLVSLFQCNNILVYIIIFMKLSVLYGIGTEIAGMPREGDQGMKIMIQESC